MVKQEKKSKRIARKTIEDVLKPMFLIVDLFCGAGGTTTGFTKAKIKPSDLFKTVEEFGRIAGFDDEFARANFHTKVRVAKVVACVNHDPVAIKSHWLNHKEVRHFEEDIRILDLTELVALVKQYRELYPDAKLILWASLECTNFSKAKGGQARDADSRTLALHLFKYIHALQPDYIQIENVVEFMSWGPMKCIVTKTADGFDCCEFEFKETDEAVTENGLFKLEADGSCSFVKKMKPFFKGVPESRNNGKDWLMWCNTVKSMGFYDEWREMNSANFGAYTSRNRLFGCFAKHDLPIVWPEATHAKNPSKGGIFGDLKKWKAVKEVLNFEDEGESIFTRKKPLSDKTLERIYAGLVKYVAKGDTSFISKYYSGRPAGKVTSTNMPAGTITTVGGQTLVQTEFLVQRNSGDPERKLVDINGPARTLTSTGGNQDLVQPKFLLKYNSCDKNGKHTPPSIEDPCPVVSCQGRLGIVQVELTSNFLQHYYGNGFSTSMDEPCPTLTTKERCALVKPKYFLDQQYGQSNPSDVDSVAGTITNNPKLALVGCDPFIIPTNFDNQAKSIDEPLQTITANRKHHYIINPSHGGNNHSIEVPCPVIVARQDKAPLYFVQVEAGSLAIAIFDCDSEVMIRIKQFMSVYGLVDIKMRMLRVLELLKIQGFPEGYKLKGTQTDKKKFIGNSVHPIVVKKWSEAMAAKLIGAKIISFRSEKNKKAA